MDTCACKCNTCGYMWDEEEANIEGECPRCANHTHKIICHDNHIYGCRGPQTLAATSK